MEKLDKSNIRYSYGCAAANLYYTHTNTTYRLCFDWSYDYIYFKVDNQKDVEINLINFDGTELLDTNIYDIFVKMCEYMIGVTENYDYNRVQPNRKKLIILVDKIKNQSQPN